MKRPIRLLDGFTNAVNLSAEPLPGTPLVEILGDSRVLIEHYHGITEYSNKEIRVRVKYGCILISGCAMELVHMSKDQLVICGHISGITLLSGGKG